MAEAPKEWQDGMRRLMAEGNETGLAFYLLYPETSVDLLAAAILGDRQAATLLTAGDKLIRQLGAASYNQRPLCLCCPRKIKKQPGALAILLKAGDDPHQAVGMFLCDVCAKGDWATVRDKAMAALRTCWPDLREIPAPTHPDGGRA